MFELMITNWAQVFALLHALLQLVVWTPYCKSFSFDVASKVPVYGLNLSPTLTITNLDAGMFLEDTLSTSTKGRDDWLAKSFGQICSCEVWHSHPCLNPCFSTWTWNGSSMPRFQRLLMRWTSHDITCLSMAAKLPIILALPHKNANICTHQLVSLTSCAFECWVSPSISQHSSWPLLPKKSRKWVLVVFCYYYTLPL